MTRIDIKAMINEDMQNESRMLLSTLNITVTNSFVSSFYSKTYCLLIQKTYNN